MSSARATDMSFLAPAIVRTIQRRSLVIGLVFAAIAAVGAFTRPDEFFRAYLIGYMDFLGLTLGSLAFLMVRHVTGGTWGMVIQRIQIAAMRCLPLMIVLFIPILFGLPHLYIWARPLDTVADPHLREHLRDITRTYLNPHGFILRAVFYFAVWYVLVHFFSKWSAELDNPPLRDTSTRTKQLAAPGILLYALTIGFATIDWMMSITPGWISTMYPLVILIGQLMGSMALCIVMERILSRYEPMATMLKPNFAHDHGKWTLAFVMVWAYFSFSQLLIMWAGNLPEEITYYYRRFHGCWWMVGIFLVLFQFAVPFCALLSRSLKRNIGLLAWLGAWILVARWVDIYYMVEPNYSETFMFTWLDVVVAFALGGLWFAFFCRNLASRPLLAAYDAQAQKVLEPVHGGH